MNTATVRTTHPLVIIAAIAVTLFCLAGIAALMGWLPSSKGDQPAASGVAAAVPANAAAAPEKTAAAEPREAAPAHRVQHTRISRPAPTPVSEPAPRYEPPAQVAAADMPPPPPAAPVAAETPRPPVCNTCGMVESVRAIHRQGSGSGVGAAAGGLLGGVLGHQLGNGRGQDLMTVVGAVGGALAGNQVEKNRSESTLYETTVRYDDGTTERLTQAHAPAWRQGDRVRVVNGSIRLM